MMKSWSRRFAVLVFAGALALLPSSAAPAAAAKAVSRTARVERQEVVQPGLLPAALSYVHGLLARALAVVTPAPAPFRPPATSSLGGDNGAGIDPNGI
jgi:hypothetical protein